MSATVGPGSRFAGYEVESLVGRGGMGVVYRARDPRLERPVALKLIAPELAQDERFRSRFLKEPRLAAALDHPHVIPIYDAGDCDGQLYLAMRYVEGTDLGTVLDRERRLEPARALELLDQVADALDAAHRRGLVHRDVKPANILIDVDGHAYLTDFGITKQVGAASTQTGAMVGTLDYMAPEQIRGEPVDGRSDLYALGCILYACLTGAPPFRRDTPAEAMWAHLQAEPPRAAHWPAVDPVVRKALAKDRDERHATCRELIAAARAALGLATAAPAPTARARLVHHRRAILGAGVLVLAIVGAMAVVALTSGGGGRAAAPVGTGVVVLGPGGSKVSSFIQSADAPSNIAVGERAIWVVSSQRGSVSRIDPKTKAVTRRIRTPGVATDIAAGAGAVWIGKGGGPYGGNITVGLWRVDPRTGRVTRTVPLSNRRESSYSAPYNWGYPNIAVGAGAVWAIDPDQTVSRIDPRTGKVVKVIVVHADRIAAGREGVWVLSGNAVTRIDPRTNRLGQTIHIGSPAPTALAVGAGKVWVSAEQEGVIWRIEPGSSPVTSTIRVGEGVTYLAFGAGSVWAANYVDGVVSRIDPGTSDVKARIPVAGAQALAAGADAAWVSSAGGSESGALPASSCGELVSAPGRSPDLLMVSDLPLQGPSSAGPKAMAEAVRSVLRAHDYRAGRFSVGYRSCDDSTAQTGNFENRRCAANANAYARADKLVAVMGPFNSGCAQVEIPILNRAPGGAVPIVGATTTYQGLTRGPGMPPPNGYRHEPQVYYPTGVRNFVRLLPGDDQLAGAQAVLAQQLGLKRVYVLDDGGALTKYDLAEPFRRAARRLRVPVVGSARFDPMGKSFTAVAEAMARAHPDGVVLAADPFHGGADMLKAIRARLGPRIPVLAHFFFLPVPSVLEAAGRAAHGVYVATNDLARGALPLTPAARRFVSGFGDSPTQFLGVLEVAQATELVLRAIARSDGTRASVLRALRASKVRNGLLGTFAFDRNGDNTAPTVPIMRITGTTPPNVDLPDVFRGSVLDRVVEVPASLVE